MIYLLCFIVLLFGGWMIWYSRRDNSVAMAVVGGIVVAIAVWFIGTAIEDDIRRDNCIRLSSEINKPTRYDSYSGCKIRYKQQWITPEQFDRMETK